MMYRKFFKRIIDIVISFIGLLLLCPLFFLIIIFLYAFNKGANPFYVQSRPGKNTKVFKLIKFKTMTDAMDTNGNYLPDSKRLTKIGTFIRSTSLDELPQLFNVLKGEMSIIGPRPLLIKYIPLYSTKQSRRHEVRPGMTGWAQVNGRNSISWKQRLELDVWYVDNLSLIVDLKILFMTIKKVLRREGISSSTSVTMEAFKGNDN